MSASIFLNSFRGRLSEGVTYNPSNNSLLWVDIIEAQVNRVKLNQQGEAIESTHQSIKLNDPSESIGAIALTKDENKVLVCAKYGVGFIEFTDFANSETSPNNVETSISYLVRYPQDHLDMRSNDGIIDPWGNLWIGTMSDFHVGHIEPKGKLYRIDCKDLSVKTMLDNCQIPNGLAFSADGTKLFWTDSLTFTIWQFDYDNEKLELSHKKPYIETKKIERLAQIESPEPDGFTTTIDGDIFTAVFSSSCIFQFDPQGQLIAEYKLPAKRVTSCCLGGPDRNILYVTSGQLHLDNPSKCETAEVKKGDLGGFLFRIQLSSHIKGKDKNIWGCNLLQFEV